ncbi:MAG: hypothetical protein QOH21_3443, partial [Acidobacteriota bacterium]|nr:hypothetical protein [Acidobacteriota bacterium]
CFISGGCILGVIVSTFAVTIEAGRLGRAVREAVGRDPDAAAT